MGLRREQRDYWTNWNGDSRAVVDAAIEALAVLRELEPEAVIEGVIATFENATYKRPRSEPDFSELEALVESDGEPRDLRVLVGGPPGYGTMIGADRDGVSVTTGGPDLATVEEFHAAVSGLVEETVVAPDPTRAIIPRPPSTPAEYVFVDSPSSRVPVEASATSAADKSTGGVLQWIEHHPALVTAAATVVAAILVIVFAS